MRRVRGKGNGRVKEKVTETETGTGTGTGTDIARAINNTSTSAAGFTLLEVLMTLAILGMILALVVPKYDSSILSSKEQAQQADRLRLEGAVELYRLDTGIFPSSLDDLLYSPSNVKGWRGPYIDKIPSQPDGRPYILNAQGKVGI